LGKGLILYQALDGRVKKGLAEPDQNHRYQTIALLCQVYRTAHAKKMAGVIADVKTFAFEVLPPILKQQTSNHESAVSTVAQTVHDLVGPRDGIVFLLDE